ncbi:MAG TPA: OmpA family protein [Rhizomicrobium sp.]|nr:OmpA family protein [Rhizomicrobium sp.]
MTVEFGGVKTICARMVVIGMVAFGATACSSAPDWVDPTNWFGGGPSDTEATPGETPDLASIPDRPVPASTSDEQKQVADSLAADRARAKYSSDALRGGTEAAAAPPPPATEEAANDTAPAPASSTATTAAAAPAPSTQVASNDQPSAPPPTPAQDASGEVTVPPPAPAANDLPPAQPSPANTVSASTSPPAASYTPPPAPAPTAMATVSPSDAALGFKPSSAPPLDASVGQFVPPPLVARYNQTVGQSGTTPPRMAYATPPKSGKAMGGPEKMSGAVVANLEALQAPAQASTYTAMQGVQPTSVVLFPGDGTLLNASARAQVRAAVEAFKAAGGQGYLRIVGHASSRTSNMPLEKHLEVIFNKSQDRANAVAKEIIKEGVPASRVLVEAVGDSQPVYYESMPQGEDGNRRAEIFLQS